MAIADRWRGFQSVLFVDVSLMELTLFSLRMTGLFDVFLLRKDGVCPYVRHLNFEMIFNQILL